MKLQEILTKINLNQVNKADVIKDVSTLYIGDLLSFVMANGESQALWLTVQRHINVIAVAELNEFSGIIFVENVFPDEQTIQKANELNIPLFVSDLDTYQLCKQFMAIGL